MMGRRVLPITPIEAYRKWRKKNGKGRFIVGELLSLKRPIDDIPKGHYVFLGRRGATMELAAVPDGHISRRRKLVKVHSDFEDMFRSRGWIGRLESVMK